MRISEASWIKYIGKLRQINNEAADKMAAYLYEHEFTSAAGRRAALDYAFALSTRYGEAATALACEMYDAVSAASGVAVLAAEPAETATYAEVAKTVNGAFKQTESPDVVSQAVGRLVKRAGVDTTMKNAIRDGAEWAWIPHGDTCAFCITLASRGWQKASRAALKGNHAEHIHSNCDCTYAIRFGRDTTYAGYDPDKYLEAYENADGSKPQDKINALRRQHYAENKDRINEQKRIAYAKRKGMSDLTKAASVEFDDRVSSQQKEIIQRLTGEYNTRLQRVTVGAEKAAGDVDITGARMRLSDKHPETAIHEFAHSMAGTEADRVGLTDNGEFWKEIRSIRRSYHKDVDALQDTSRWISTYEHSSRSVDEFMAEAFTHAKMRELGLPIPSKYGKDFTYSRRVLDAVNKYFHN